MLWQFQDSEWQEIHLPTRQLLPLYAGKITFAHSGVASESTESPRAITRKSQVMLR